MRSEPHQNVMICMHLGRGQQAVTAGLALPYSSAAMEGNVNKIKMIKRQMYGRAAFPLLRKRVILHPG